MGRRVVITGLGAISPLGIGVDELWEGLSQGKCGIDTIKAFDPAEFTCKIAGEVDQYKIRNHVPKTHRKACKLMSRDIELSIIAANEAVADSGLVTKYTDPDNVTVEPGRFAINMGAGLISCDLVELSPSVAKSITDGEFDIHKWGTDGLTSLTPLWLLKYLPNMLPCHVGIIHDIQGPSNTITCGEVGGHLAIGEAGQMIARGDADVALAGACEAKVNPIVMIRQCLLKRATDKSNDNPEGACRPFDADASGAVFGEGAGMVVLEEIEHAKSRGAKIYAELVSLGSSTNINNAYEHVEKDGTGIRIAIEQALENAGLSASDIDLLIPCGTGIAEDDAAEAKAIKETLGDVAVWPIKSMVSHTGAASGAIDLLAAAKAMETATVGPAKNFDGAAEGCELNINTQETKKDIRYAMVTGYTFGGQTAALIISKVD